MFVYKNYFEIYGSDRWKGVALPTSFYSNLYMPFNEADNLEITDLAINHLILQRDDVSIYSVPGKTVPIRRSDTNISTQSIAHRNDFTEFNGDMNGNAEGGDLSFGGEAIEAVVIRRSSSRTKFHIWEDIAVIPVTTTSLYTLDKIIYDPYIEHGITYQYAIQPVGSIGRGAQYETLRNMAVFDDIWLIGSDTKQLMMGYNPVVSNYRYIVKDTAIETIGSKYPYVVRNANVGYNQFNFSCTITAHMNIINDKEIFTPFVDIEVLDEYKDIIVGESGGSNDGDKEEVLRPTPTPEATLKLVRETKVRTNERKEDSTNKTAATLAGVGGPYIVLESDLPGQVYKIQFPISEILSYGEYDPRAEAIANGTVEMYDKWTNDHYETIWVSDPGNPGQVKPEEVLVKGKDWLPMFIDAKDILAGSITGQEQIEQEIRQLRERSFSVPNEELEEKVMEIRKNRNSSKGFDPAYPSSPQSAKSVDANLTVVTSDKEFMLEREFRNRVVEFIYDGRPKIFKSPTEGLMLVKLTDISLTPNTTLGRMIYDFSCTCTEIGKVNSETLAKYGFRDSRGDILITGANDFETEMETEEAAKLYELFRNK